MVSGSFLCIEGTGNWTWDACGTHFFVRMCACVCVCMCMCSWMGNEIPIACVFGLC